MQNNVEQDVDNSCCFHIVNNERGEVHFGHIFISSICLVTKYIV